MALGMRRGMLIAGIPALALMVAFALMPDRAPNQPAPALAGRVAEILQGLATGFVIASPLLLAAACLGAARGRMRARIDPVKPAEVRRPSSILIGASSGAMIAAVPTSWLVFIFAIFGYRGGGATEGMLFGAFMGITVCALPLLPLGAALGGVIAFLVDRITRGAVAEELPPAA
jgi:hypothetical protein